MFSPRVQYTALRRSGFSRCGANGLVALMPVAMPFTALAVRATLHEVGFGKFERGCDRDDSK